jgi:hypothetical protein
MPHLFTIDWFHSDAGLTSWAKEIRIFSRLLQNIVSTHYKYTFFSNLKRVLRSVWLTSFLDTCQKTN